MALKKHLGKISSIRFGLGGYQDTMLGVHICFDINDSDVICTDKTYWDSNTIQCSESSRWTEKDRESKFADIMYYLSDLLSQGQVRSLSELKGMPVEIRLDGINFYSWRFLTEVV